MRADPDLSAGLLDGTVARASAGAAKNQVADPARGHSRGDFSTQIHLLTDRQGRPLGLRMTAGTRNPSLTPRSGTGRATP